jgi:hypothetical protein
VGQFVTKVEGEKAVMFGWERCGYIVKGCAANLGHLLARQSFPMMRRKFHSIPLEEIAGRDALRKVIH